MKKIQIDTNGYAAFKRNNPIALEILRTAEYIGISVVVIGELLGGFKGGNKEKKNMEELNKFLDSPRVYILQIDEETAEFYAKIYWGLKKKGNPIPSNDMWVAASTMRHGISLFTFDEHFHLIDGLILKNTTF
ncbi:MAG: putative ribonuclease VapC [Candidatus Gottesmanbacteria bacterium GW2011_GWC2_39_8]|uniref:Putative ribonuclease VapC n=1 Tax=Candidatus Gottesmanbacteria bacterium GW2011_GWC2_39_8 TaxID=1618450 RepID=A0A0G0PQ61_9BACT|nr:MAG: putative ribonuclease VapC [Candidatus Gottesmanbacteria bacterium GW2011_GWC2_39_8]